MTLLSSSDCITIAAPPCSRDSNESRWAVACWAEGLDLQVQDNKLTLFGRISRTDALPISVIHQEYQLGDFLRSFILSDEVDHERIQAKLTNGVLRVDLPRAARAKPRRIEVSPG